MGVITAVVVVGIVVICVMECISELVQLFPAPLAVYYYMETFVDKEFAWVAAIAYWWVFTRLTREG